MDKSLLELLVGTWDVKIVLPTDTNADIHGKAFIEWIDGGHFLTYRSGVSDSNFPSSSSIIGSDGTMGSYTMLYYDSRNVTRIYQMSLNEQVWKLWRDDPVFMQRFTGKFSDKGNTITAAWENSTDGGSTWELDFDIFYTRVSTQVR